ncbi:hypothetical protein QTP86_031275, partial [Hemibagrus guttatus]
FHLYSTMAALFVKGLHPQVSEAILFYTFSHAGQVQSVHICRDRKTGYPLGYAYVNFCYREDADRAIEMFNFELLLGRPMQVMWSNWEPTAKTIKGGNIFIRNLDPSIDSTSLFDTFSMFGRIVSCKVVESKGYGYVQYESVEAAAEAIEWLNGKLLKDCQVTIEYFKSWEERLAEVRKIEARKAEETKVEARKAEEPKVEARKAEEPKVEVEARKAEEPKVEARKAEEPKVEARPSSQHLGNRKFFKKLDLNTNRKCLRNVTPKLCNIPPNLRQPVLTPSVKRSTPAVETPSSGDTPLQTTEAYASENVAQINTIASLKVRAAKSPATVDGVEAVETAGTEDSEEAVETAASEGTVEAVETAASAETVEAVVTKALEGSVEAVETTAPEDEVEATETSVPEETLEAVETAVPEDNVKAVDIAVSEVTVPATLQEAHKAEEPMVEARKAEEPKVEACPSSQHLGNRKFFKKLDLNTNRKCLRKVPPKLCNIPPNLRQPVLNPSDKRSTPAVETPSSGDTLPTTEAYASEDIAKINTGVNTAASQKVQAAESPAPVDGVEAVETAGTEDSEEAVETAASEGTVEAVETAASAETVEAVVTKALEGSVEAVETTDVPKFPPPQKRLTIYMLESADLDDQITIAHDYLLPLVAEIHPADANQITWMLVQGENNFEIMNMIGDPEHLQAKVDKMDALLRAREAGVKPEILNRIFRDGTKKRKKKKNKRKN